MRTSRTRQLALILSAAAIAVAGCGGSSTKHSTPAGGGTGTSGTTGSSILSSSTPVSSTAYKTALASKLAQIAGLPSADIPKIVNCAVQKLTSQGITTVGDVHAHHSEANADGVSCAHSLGLK